MVNNFADPNSTSVGRNIRIIDDATFSQEMLKVMIPALITPQLLEYSLNHSPSSPQNQKSSAV